ncbi:PucR family transcriptional regulator [Streptomyces platensis]|uniref:PucR family transcriptional regulator n=1 Tax=Streptomyces platensis TaxID=58346 RepID=UPI003C2C4BA5
MNRELTARTLVEDLGSTVLRLAIERGDPDQPLTGVAIHDGATADQLEPGSVVLGVGVHGDAALREFAADMAAAGARAIVVKGPLPAAFDDCPLPVVEVNPGASWLHIAATVRERLLDRARGQLRSDDTGDLFSVANTISALLGAPVTIEDRSSAVLAWSAGQDRTDEARVETILGRAVTPRGLAALEARGVFARLHADPDPVYVEPTGPGLLPRVAIAVRAGSDVLGYVWAVVTGPLSAERSRELRELMPLVALHLVNARIDDTRARQHRRELATAVLGGGPAGLDAAGRLPLGDGPLCVLAAGRRGAAPPAGDADMAIELRRFEDALERYLAAVHPTAVAVAGDCVVYGVLSWPRRTPKQAVEASRALARDFLGRSAMGREYVIAVGGPGRSLAQVPAIRKQADATVRALRLTGDGEPAVGTLEDAALPVLLLGLADIAGNLGLPAATGALRRLDEKDGPQGLLRTSLSAYLDAGGSTETAAAKLQIHVNTMRYRLRRIREVSGLDFANADAVLLAHLQLRLAALRGAVMDADDTTNPAS